MIDVTNFTVPYMILIRTKDRKFDSDIEDIVKEKMQETFKDYPSTVYMWHNTAHVTSKLGIVRYEVTHEELFGDIKTYLILRLTEFKIFS